MGRKVISVILLCLLLFPVGVYLTSKGAMEVTGQQAEAEKYAQQYFKQNENLTGPCTKEDGSKFTIGYMDIDPYPASGEMIYYFVDELRKAGWIEYDGEFPFDPQNVDAKAFIDFLSKQDLGPYICFSEKVNYYTSEEYDGKEFIKQDLKKRIENKEVDLIFCLGTSPADLMINEMEIRDVPIMVSGTVDPVASKLADTEEYSGKSNIWCHTNTGVYTNQMKFYYNTKPFTNIGMVYYDETIASLVPYQEAAKDMGFTISTRKIDGIVDDDYYGELESLYKELVAEGIDAFLLNSDIIKDETQIEPLLNIFYEKNIPVFVQNSEFFVGEGALLAVIAHDAVSQSPFLVDVFSKILHGEEPGQINQKFVTPPFLSINLETAGRINYPISSDMIISAERLYCTTEDEAE